MIYDFKFGDYWLSELGGMSAAPPSMEIAQRDFTLVEIPGKDGSEIIENNRYKNVDCRRDIVVLNGGGFTAEEKVKRIIEALAYAQGYQSFEDTYHEGFVTEAVLINFGAVAQSLRTFKRATLEFSRKPFWIEKQALEEIEISSPYESTALRNPYATSAKPIFRFYLAAGHSPTSLSFRLVTDFGSGGTYRLFSANNFAYTQNHNILEFNSEKGTVAVKSASGAITEYLDVDAPPQIGEKMSYFQLTTPSSSTGIVTAVKYIPRWRCL